MLKKEVLCVCVCVLPVSISALASLNHRWTRRSQSGHWHPQPCLKGESKHDVEGEWKKKRWNNRRAGEKKLELCWSHKHWRGVCTDKISRGEHAAWQEHSGEKQMTVSACKEGGQGRWDTSDPRNRGNKRPWYESKHVQRHNQICSHQVSRHVSGHITNSSEARDWPQGLIPASPSHTFVTQISPSAGYRHSKCFSRYSCCSGLRASVVWGRVGRDGNSAPLQLPVSSSAAQRMQTL